MFNAGRQIGPVPAHIEIDLDDGWATWVSLMGTEEVHLPDGLVPAPDRVLIVAVEGRQYSGSGSRAEPGRAAGPCRWASCPSTSETIVSPGASPYCSFRSAR